VVARSIQGNALGTTIESLLIQRVADLAPRFIKNLNTSTTRTPSREHSTSIESQLQWLISILSGLNRREETLHDSINDLFMPVNVLQFVDYDLANLLTEMSNRLLGQQIAKTLLQGVATFYEPLQCQKHAVQRSTGILVISLCANHVETFFDEHSEKANFLSEGFDALMIAQLGQSASVVHLSQMVEALFLCLFLALSAMGGAILRTVFRLVPTLFVTVGIFAPPGVGWVFHAHPCAPLFPSTNTVAQKWKNCSNFEGFLEK
jgi:hypothetical protein